MILVTGAAGFVGQRLLDRLAREGREVRALIRPSHISPKLPPGLAVQAAISSLADERGLRAALVGVDTVFHLAGVDWTDPRDDMRGITIDGTRNLLEACRDAGVKRLIFLSHLDADRAAAFPELKAKGIAEEFIRLAPIPYTIVRSALIFGPNDHFTVPLAQLMAFSPRAFLMPGDGAELLQPIWLEDLVSCLGACLDDEETVGKTLEIGGPEHISFRQIAELVLQQTGLQRNLLAMRPSYLRILIPFVHTFVPRLPVSTYWLDYLAADRICELDSVPRAFELMPARFSQHLEYLQNVDWRVSMRTRMVD